MGGLGLRGARRLVQRCDDMKKPWENDYPILLVDESVCTLEIAIAISDAKPGEIIFVPPGFSWIELNPKDRTVKEGGFMFEWCPEGLRRLR